MLQGECLRDFYGLLSLIFVDSKKVVNFEIPSNFKTIYGYMGVLGGMEYLTDPASYIQNHLFLSHTSSELRSARENNEIIDKIKVNHCKKIER